MHEQLDRTEKRLQRLATDLFVHNFAENAHGQLHEIERDYQINWDIKIYYERDKQRESESDSERGAKYKDQEYDYVELALCCTCMHTIFVRSISFISKLENNQYYMFKQLQH